METHRHLTRRRLLIALGALPLAQYATAADIELARTGGPYVPTPQIVVDEMLRMAKVGADDFVVDLGSGDGIIVLTAATRLKARGLGVDIDPELVQFSNSEARKRGVADRASFRVMDVFKADISKASVVTLYLLPGMMTDLRPKIFGELKPGTRVVSHDYSFGDEWRPDDQYTWDVPEKEKVNGVPRATIYLWIIPAQVAGRWQLNLAAPVAERYDLAIKQRYQSLEGVVSGSGAKGVRLTQSHLQGETISFAFPAGGDRHRFKGRVSGNTMEGTVELAGGKGAAKWTATRL
ncbi:MAG TPA: methyltransferase domain-containing protein [Burkholderiales bacterium]|nr:methyltransferase domain-containing protein [Burkholderiales bacterium]